MIRVKRAMTPMGMAIAAGKEMISLRYGHTLARAPRTRPPVSFRGEWGELQREARCGAIAERAKIASTTIKWSQVAIRLSSHRRLQFRKRKCPTQIPQHPFVGPILFRRKKAQKRKDQEM